MAHMKLKQIPKRKKAKYFLLIIVLYLMFAYTFYNSFKNNQEIMNQEFINYIVANGNANLKNDYKLPKVIGKTMNYLLKIDFTNPETLLNQSIIGYEKSEEDENIDLEHLKNISMNFGYKDWLNCNYKNIEFAYETDSFFSILYLFMWKLTKLNNVVYVCKNCGKYFIPDFQYNSKYCNNIYSES